MGRKVGESGHSGVRCPVLRFLDTSQDRLFARLAKTIMQIKNALASVLERVCGYTLVDN